MLLASPINLIAHSRRWQAVIALDFHRMHSLAFQFFLLQPIVKRNMRCIRNVLFVEAVNTFRIGAMLT